MPIATSDPPADPAQEPVAAGSRILIVDDNQDSADSLAMLMRLTGNDVRVAYDGHEALDIAAAFAPAVVLLDIGLVGLDGHSVARELRRRENGTRALLVATTGWSRPEDVERSHASGFDHHLVKPVDPAKLAALVREHTAA